MSLRRSVLVVVSLVITCSSGWSADRADDRSQLFPPINLAKLTTSPPPMTVAFDIKPGACPNPINVNKNSETLENAASKKGGVLPAAILGSSAFDVYDIDPSTVLLEGIAPIRHGYEDVAAPAANTSSCECTSDGPDGLTDLTLKFRMSEVAAVIGTVYRDDVVELTLTGQLMDGTSIQATECVTIIGPPRPDDALPRATLVLESAYHPWWSPDGSTLLCARINEDPWDDYPRIWRVEPDGANPQMIIDDPSGAFFPLWLPADQGQYIVYDRLGSPPYEYVLFDLLSGTIESVYTVPSAWDDYGYSLVPTGDHMLYTVSSSPDEIWMLDLTDGSYQYLRDGRGGAISPDGNWIAFGDENDQLTVDSMGGGTPQAFGVGAFPSWTPDSEYIVYTGFSAEEQFDLFIASRDGLFNRQLTDDSDWDWYPQVSPDASQVAFNKGSGESGPWSIWVLDLTGIVPMDRPEPKNPKVFSTPGTQPKQDIDSGTSFRLAGPNPTNPSSSFEFTLDEPGNVRLEIYDVRGRLIRRVVSETKPAGNHLITWNGHDENGQHVSSGVYFYVFESGAYRTTGKITVVR